MLLTALLDGERVETRTHDAGSWAALQASETRKRLVMPVCGIRAVAKTRGAATRFFAHYRSADCAVDHGGESAQHLAMKKALAAGIEAVPGWHAVIEYPHPSREWIIDVLAESDDMRHRAAFEVQLSSQTPAKYFSRSQRYFDSGAFPIWLVPRPLEYSLVQVPTVVTGFGKTSAIPDDPATLLGLEIKHNLELEQRLLSDFITDLLTHGHRWGAGTPKQQQDRHEAEQRRAADADLVRAERIIKAQAAVAESNRRSVAPEKVFEPHTVHTQAGPFVWATLSDCWKCGRQMLLWEASSARSGEQYSSAPPLKVKNDVGLKRYENHPDVHRAIGQWMAEAGASVTKARIELRRSQSKGQPYSSFVCPHCGALMGQLFIAQITPEHWSLLSAPLLRSM